MTTVQVAPLPTVPGRAPRTGRLLAILLIGQFMAVLDVSVVNVAARTISLDLHASGAGLQMVIAGYTIAYSMLLVTGARLGNRLGHRRLFLAGLALFSAASLACGLAPTTGTLIAFRLVQGTGAALMVPQVISLIQHHFTGMARAKALGRYAGVLAGGIIVGQVAGGALVAADLWGTAWRPIFLVNVPIGVVLLIVAWRALPRDSGDPGRALDISGLVTLSAAVLLFVVPLVLGREEHWPVWGWVSLGASTVVLAWFVGLQRRVAAPLVPARVVRAPGLVPALVANFVSMAGYGGFLITMALHLQAGLGYSPLRAGLCFVVGSVCFGTTSLNWRRVPARWHRAMIPAGLTVATVGFAVLALAVHDGNHLGVLFWLSQACFGLGMGGAVSPMVMVALARVPAADAADASGLLTTTTQLAQVVGVATYGTLYLALAGHGASGHALAVTSALEALLNLVAIGAALLLPRPPTAR
jgi:MFS family permease